MKQIYRFNTFETNSSSSHSLVIKNQTKKDNKLTYVIKPKGYGLEYEILATPYEKISYILTALISCKGYTKEEAIETINKRVGRKIIADVCGDVEDIYINHQSREFAIKLADSDYSFIFNDDIYIIVKGDCDDAPENTTTLLEALDC